jgi:HSP20 family molecular chaperone IbpA
MLPAGIDAGALSARYHAGVLEIRVPHAALQEVKVPVETGSGAKNSLKAAS